MKILFIGGGIVGGGAERVTAILANNFAARGEEVCISCEISRGIDYILSDKVRLFDHRQGCNSTFLRRKLAPLRFLHMLGNIRSYVKENKPEAVISYITTFNIYALLALIGMNVPVIAMEHTNVSFRPPVRERIMRDILYSRAAAVTVLTERDYSLWRRRFGGNVVYMPNPCESIRNGEVTEMHRRRKCIVGVGRLTDWHLKGFDSLVRCWCELCHEFPDWTLELVGKNDAASIEALDSIVKAEGGTNVRYLGFRNDIYDLLSDAQVYVLSSRREGLPMGLIEAMGVGCCCVAFDVVTGPSEIITDDEDGVLVRNQDIEEMVKALRRVLTDENLRARYGRSAPAGVLRYSVSSVIQRWYSLFAELEICQGI